MGFFQDFAAGIEPYAGQIGAGIGNRLRGGNNASSAAWYKGMQQKDVEGDKQDQSIVLQALKTGGRAGKRLLQSYMAMQGITAQHPRYQAIMATADALDKEDEDKKMAMQEAMGYLGMAGDDKLLSIFDDPQKLAAFYNMSEQARQRKYQEVAGGATLYDTSSGQPTYTAPKQFSPSESIRAVPGGTTLYDTGSRQSIFTAPKQFAPPASQATRGYRPGTVVYQGGQMQGYVPFPEEMPEGQEMPIMGIDALGKQQLQPSGQAPAPAPAPTSGMAPVAPIMSVKEQAAPGALTKAQRDWVARARKHPNNRNVPIEELINYARKTK